MRRFSVAGATSCSAARLFRRFGPDAWPHPPPRLDPRAEAAEGRERLADDLVHIVITIGCQPAHEADAGGRIRERLIFLVERLIFGPRDRGRGIALGRRILV